jgi:Hypoxia induced protein conserved region
VADIVNRLAPLAVAAVAVVLFLGMVNMMRGGSSNRSQTLMRWRVILQFIAIVAVMTALYVTQVFKGGG